MHSPEDFFGFGGGRSGWRGACHYGAQWQDLGASGERGSELGQAV